MEQTLSSMLSSLRHRGPDENGTFLSGGAGLGHDRLSIVGIKNGRQPLSNEAGTVWLVCAGEIFNYKEIRGELTAKGHYFKTLSDIEVLLHLYEEEGIACLSRLNGQFAFALLDLTKQELYLGRDRLGILPLYWTGQGDAVIFASEIKGLLQYPGIEAQTDLRGLCQIFTFWTTLAPRTAFKGIQEVLPGHYLKISKDAVEDREYWDITFPPANDYEENSEEKIEGKLRELLEDSVKIRCQADVPVGLYLSGGMDSALVAALMKKAGAPPETFSVTFADHKYDESTNQKAVTDFLSLKNTAYRCIPEDLGPGMEVVVRCAEQPLMRTAPVPLFYLAKRAREQGTKTVMAGEGADEFLLGYDIFKETKIRRYWAREPRSRRRPALLDRLYTFLPFVRGNASYMKSFFSQGLEGWKDPLYSHLPRWNATSNIRRFFSGELALEAGNYDPLEELRASLKRDFHGWGPIEKAQYLEAKIFMGGYLLSSQGDRVAMGNGLEVRYPFLDHRLVEFCNRVPPKIKMRGLHEKCMLKKIASRELPREITGRDKFPYRAPSVNPSVEQLKPYLDRKALGQAGYFDAKLATGLASKLGPRSGSGTEIEQMAMNGILSTQIFHERFIRRHVV